MNRRYKIDKVQSDITLYKRLFNQIRPYWQKILLAMCLMIFVAGISSTMAYIVKPVMDDIFVAKNSSMLSIMPLLVIILYAFKGISFYGQTYLMQNVGQRIIAQYRINLYAHLQYLDLSYYDRMPTGELMSRITNDVNQIQSTTSSVVTGLLKDCFTILGLIIVIFYRDWSLGILAIGIFPLCAILLIRFGRRLRRISANFQETMADVSVLLHETITGVRIVKGFCREDYEIKRFSKEAFRLFQLRMKDISIRAISSPLMEFLGGVGIASIIFYGGWQVIENRSTPGTFFSFLAALIMLYEPIKRLSALNNEIQNGLAAAKRIYEILDTKPQVQDKLKSYEIFTFQKSIEFREVTFGYRPNIQVLKNINFYVPAGQVLALVGASGSGKTTLINLLSRFYDVQEGVILIDGIDLRKITLKSLRSQIAIVSQQTILFNDTVSANIAYANTEASYKQIEKAAEAAYAIDFIKRLPKGFNSRIGESGIMLSGGERQRLSIARALLANRPILILDEATSNLDIASEQYVQKALENLIFGRTTFIIAHRLSTIQLADRIIVLNKGRIVEEGRHEELLVLDGLYQQLYFMQSSLEKKSKEINDI